MVFGRIVIVPNLPVIFPDATPPKPQPAGAVASEVDQRSILSCQRRRYQRSLGNKRESETDGEGIKALPTFVL